MCPDCNNSFERTLACLFYHCQVVFSRNHLANKVYRPISLYLKARGTAVKAFDTKSALGATLTQKWALTAVESLVKIKMDDLVNRVKTTSFHTTHDNINRMFRVLHQMGGTELAFRQPYCGNLNGLHPPNRTWVPVPDIEQGVPVSSGSKREDPGNPT